jgi:hypothetical protein
MLTTTMMRQGILRPSSCMSAASSSSSSSRGRGRPRPRGRGGGRARPRGRAGRRMVRFARNIQIRFISASSMSSTTTMRQGILRPSSYMSAALSSSSSARPSARARGRPSAGGRPRGRPGARGRPRGRPGARGRRPIVRFANRVRRRIIPHYTDPINQFPLALQGLLLRRRSIPPVDTASGSVWVDGLRRSARSQPVLGSIVVNGLRRSARLL